ncbi:hypothetical protein C8R44DRAFT_732641 [Mycena epipterygia]|nr:hypothetical protein C8R44DRAFT_732641 [Mycena epipterygia]
MPNLACDEFASQADELAPHLTKSRNPTDSSFGQPGVGKEQNANILTGGILIPLELRLYEGDHRRELDRALVMRIVVYVRQRLESTSCPSNDPHRVQSRLQPREEMIERLQRGGSKCAGQPREKPNVRASDRKMHSMPCGAQASRMCAIQKSEEQPGQRTHKKEMRRRDKKRSKFHVEFQEWMVPEQAGRGADWRNLSGADRAEWHIEREHETHDVGGAGETSQIGRGFSTAKWKYKKDGGRGREEGRKEKEQVQRRQGGTEDSRIRKEQTRIPHPKAGWLRTSTEARHIDKADARCPGAPGLLERRATSLGLCFDGVDAVRTRKSRQERRLRVLALVLLVQVLARALETASVDPRILFFAVRAAGDNQATMTGGG